VPIYLLRPFSTLISPFVSQIDPDLSLFISEFVSLRNWVCSGEHFPNRGRLWCFFSGLRLVWTLILGASSVSGGDCSGNLGFGCPFCEYHDLCCSFHFSVLLGAMVCPWSFMASLDSNVATPAKPPEPGKSFAQALSSSNNLQLTQLPPIVVMGKTVRVKITQAIYESELATCRSNLHGRLTLHKGDTPMTTQGLKLKLSKQWPTIQNWELTPLGRGFFEFHFNTVEDMRRVWAMGVVNLKPGLMRFYCWTNEFNTQAQTQTHAQIWVRLMNLPQEYWHQKTLLEIASGLGTPLTIDDATVNRRFGIFARVLVDVDLSQQLFDNVIVEREGHALSVKVQYERQPSFCMHCKMLGHDIHNCSKLNTQTKSAELHKESKKPVPVTNQKGESSKTILKAQRHVTKDTQQNQHHGTTQENFIPYKDTDLNNPNVAIMNSAIDLTHLDSSDHEFFSTEGEDRNGADADAFKRTDDTPALSLRNAFDLLKEVNELPLGEAKKSERNVCHSSEDDYFEDFGVADNASKEGGNLKKLKHSKGSGNLMREPWKAYSLNSNTARKGTKLRNLRTPPLVPLPPAPQRKFDDMVSAHLARDPTVDSQAKSDGIAYTSLLAINSSIDGTSSESSTLAASTLNILLNQKTHSSTAAALSTQCNVDPSYAAQTVTSTDVVITNADKHMKELQYAADSEIINAAAHSHNPIESIITNSVQGSQNNFIKMHLDNSISDHPIMHNANLTGTSGSTKDTQGASAQDLIRAYTDKLQSTEITHAEYTAPGTIVEDLPIISPITLSEENLGPDKRKICKSATLINNSEACRKSEMILSKFWADDSEAEQTSDGTADPEVEFDDFPLTASDKYLIQHSETQKKGKRGRPRKLQSPKMLSGLKHNKAVVPPDNDFDLIHTRSKTNKKNINTQ